jgi:hypothetical protein
MHHSKRKKKRTSTSARHQKYKKTKKAKKSKKKQSKQNMTGGSSQDSEQRRDRQLTHEDPDLHAAHQISHAWSENLLTKVKGLEDELAAERQEKRELERVLGEIRQERDKLRNEIRIYELQMLRAECKHAGIYVPKRAPVSEEQQTTNIKRMRAMLDVKAKVGDDAWRRLVAGTDAFDEAEGE